MIQMILTTTLILSVFTLLVLAIIDLKTRLLPNKFVAVFATLGGIFHVASGFDFTSPVDLLCGAVAAAALLIFVRSIANRAYKRDTLGLGDVKLMGAAGLWLGLEHIFLAISLGAFAGLLHGLGVYLYMRTKSPNEDVNLSTLAIPAGPGFILGIISVGIFKFHTLALPALF